MSTEELLLCLEEQDQNAVAVAWAPELTRRSQEVSEGKVQTVPWETAREDLLGELEAYPLGATRQKK